MDHLRRKRQETQVYEVVNRGGQSGVPEELLTMPGIEQLKSRPRPAAALAAGE